MKGVYRIVELNFKNEPTLTAMLNKINREILAVKKELCYDIIDSIYRFIKVYGPYCYYGRTYGASMRYYVCCCHSDSEKQKVQQFFAREVVTFKNVMPNNVRNL